MGNIPSEILDGGEVCTCKQQPYHPNQANPHLRKKKGKRQQGSSSVASIPTPMTVATVTARKTCDDLKILEGRRGKSKGRRRTCSWAEGLATSSSTSAVGVADDEMVLREISGNRLEGGGGSGCKRREQKLSNSSLADYSSVVVVGEQSLPETVTVVSSSSKSALKDEGCKAKNLRDVGIERTFEGLSLATNDIGENVNDKRLGEDKSEDEVELPKHVVYYGWFFSPEASTTINKVVMHLFRECFDQVNQFERFILTSCKEDDVKDPFDYYGYKRPGKRIKPDDELEYHITAKFLGRSPDPPYQTLVHSFIDKSFQIHLIGIVFTPRTLGVRVKMTPAQQQIYDEKDGKSDISSGDIFIQQLQTELDSYNKNDKLHKRQNPNCKMKSDKNGILYKSISSTDSPFPLTHSSRAHITIGCARNVIPKQTGDDLVDIVDLEQRLTTRNSNFQQDFPVKGCGVLRQFGRHAEAFVFYPNFEMIVPGRFNFFV